MGVTCGQCMSWLPVSTHMGRCERMRIIITRTEATIYRGRIGKPLVTPKVFGCTEGEGGDGLLGKVEENA